MNMLAALWAICSPVVRRAARQPVFMSSTTKGTAVNINSPQVQQPQLNAGDGDLRAKFQEAISAAVDQFMQDTLQEFKGSEQTGSDANSLFAGLNNEMPQFTDQLNNQGVDTSSLGENFQFGSKSDVDTFNGFIEDQGGGTFFPSELLSGAGDAAFGNPGGVTQQLQQDSTSQSGPGPNRNNTQQQNVFP
jgi:hypothetical protein